jgi:hypothetical protein
MEFSISRRGVFTVKAECSGIFQPIRVFGLCFKEMRWKIPSKLDLTFVDLSNERDRMSGVQMLTERRDLMRGERG